MVCDTIDQTIILAVEHHRTGHLAKAKSLYRRVLEIVPKHAGALQLLGVAEYQSGQHKNAVHFLKQSIEIDARQTNVLFNLGCALSALGRHEEATTAYKRSLTIDPVHAPSHLNLGNIFRNRGCHRVALNHYLQASRITPGLAEPHFLAGNVLDSLARTHEAIRHYERAIEIDPSYAEAHNNLGAAIHNKDIERAIEHYRLALDAKPNHSGAWINLIKALSLRGLANQEAGNYREAIIDFDSVLAAQPSSGLRVQRVLVLPVVCETVQEINHQRDRLRKDIETLQRDQICIKDPVREIGTIPFYLAYHGQNDRDLLESLAAMYRMASPALSYSAEPPPKHNRLRVGFVSRHLYRHTISHFMEGWIRGLDREFFEVIVVKASQQTDEVSDRINSAADRVIEMPHDLVQAQKAIANLQCDVLIYPDIGMEPLTYFLAFARLAPVQCVWWGHPSTTGIDTIDYFLSCSDLEPKDAQAHYSEKLIQFKTLAAYTAKPSLPNDAKNRRDFGFNDRDHLYLCTQSLFKLHPDFDRRLGKILRADPRGRVILFEGRNANWTALLRKRFNRTIPDVSNRVMFLPRQPFSAFLGLIATANVILDTIHFSGGNTTLQALALGTPVVTEPGTFARGRITQACYRQMGLCELIADNEGAYVDLAVRLGTDSTYESTMRQSILNCHSDLYDNKASVKELASFLRSVSARS